MTRGWLGVIFLVGACGSVDGGGSHHDAAVDTAPHVDAPIDSKVFMDGPAGTYALTVKNYLAWCSVTVNGGTPSSGAQQIVNVTPGAIPITASALSGFKIDTNMWHHTDGDTGNGETGTVNNGTSAVTATVTNAAKCVWVCCPFTDGSGCNVADQCL